MSVSLGYLLEGEELRSEHVNCLVYNNQVGKLELHDGFRDQLDLPAVMHASIARIGL